MYELSRKQTQSLAEVRSALDEAPRARTKAQKRKALGNVNSAIEIMARFSDPIDNELAAILAGGKNWSTARMAHIADLLIDQQDRLKKELS